MPGCLALPLLGTTYRVLGLKRREIFAFHDKITRQYSPIYRTWNGSYGVVHLCDAEHIEIVLRSTVNLQKGNIYSFLKPWLGTGLLTSSGAKWHSHRKLITPAFHFNILVSFVEVFADKSEILVSRLEKEVGNSKGFDVYPYITRCALDIICETAMGTEMNAQDQTDSPYVKAVYELSELIIQRIGKPWLHSDFTYSLTEQGAKFKDDLRILHDFTKKVTRIKTLILPLYYDVTNTVNKFVYFLRKKRKAFLDLLLEASKGGTVLSDEDIREEVDTFMFEGHDTTSASMCWTLYLMALHPDVQEKVYEEQMEIFQGSDRKPTMKDLSEMKYLERVIKESLRLYPSVPFITRQVTQDIEIGEYCLPEGSEVMLHIYHVHRNHKYFPEPETFNPDNFLPERVQTRQKFALLEEKAVLSAVARRFRLRALDPPSRLQLLGELVLRPADGVRLTLQPRSTTPTDD
ncbi:Cytochrome P450 4C1 [Gryllus bimaculatus]|nr:Cytochrome P450 4C1 [Gryllus bimaculatus]